MTNLDKMKEDVIEQIKEMDVEEFENLLNYCDSFNADEEGIFNCKNLFYLQGLSRILWVLRRRKSRCWI